MQQAPNVIRGIYKCLCMRRTTWDDKLRVQQGLFEQAGQFGQRREAHRRRTARQRMRHRNDRIWQGPVQLECPFAGFDLQSPGPFVRFVEVDVVQGDRNAQIADDLDVVFGIAGSDGRHVGSRQGLDLRRGSGNGIGRNAV